MPLLEIRNLIKTYGDAQAVRGVSFGVREGICFRPLAPTGQAKQRPWKSSRGSKPRPPARCFTGTSRGRRSFANASASSFKAHRCLDHLKVREVLHLFSSFYKNSINIEKLVEQCALGEFANRDSNKLSGGQRQRLLLALGLINDPELLFLDEPTTGLDPQARRNFWDLIQGIKARGKTVLLTTHYMEEAYVLCDEIAIMDHGRIIAQGAPDKLLKQHFQGLCIELARKDVQIPLGEIPGQVFEKDGVLEIQTDRVDHTLKTLVDRQVPLSSLRVRQRDLEDLFLELTGKAIRS